MKHASHWLLIFAVAVGLTWVFWSPLWQGGGFVGGDIYSYFYPQKAYFAEHLRAGEFPLWNNRTGFGYPLIGESQTGAFYPVNLVLYPTLDLKTAYNTSFLLHYALAFLFTSMYCRRIGLGVVASILASTVYVYGWFPARCSLEWAIIGGTWLPFVLWSAESFLQRGRTRYLATLAFGMTVQLLAGHFCLAFVTVLSLIAYCAIRLLWRKSVQDGPTINSENERPVTNALRVPGTGQARPGLLLMFAVSISFVMAAIQLVPTWELKQQSQRLTVTEEHDPGYGHIPPKYLTQVVASWWFWHSPDVDVDQSLQKMKWLTLKSRTNKTEAHLYFGLLPLGLVLIGMFGGSRPGPGSAIVDQRQIFWNWGVIALFATIYTTGLLLPVTRHLPGFSFFEGLGRYGIATTFGVAIMSAIVVNQWLQTKRTRTSLSFAMFIGVCIVGLTVWDLHVVGRQMAVSIMIPSPPIDRLELSPLRQQLQQEDQPQRIFGPGPNLPNLLGHSSSPVYLGLGPAEYFDPEFRFPESTDVSDSTMPNSFSSAQQEWVMNNGITHIVSFQERPETERLINQEPFVDPFLNQAWSRRPNDRLFVQQVVQPSANNDFHRVGTTSENGSATIEKYSANRVEIKVTAQEQTEVFLKDLFFPGWTVEVDGQSAEAIRFQRLFRSVKVPAGEHTVTWNYQPASLWRGIIASVIGLLVLLIVCRVFRSNGTDTASAIR